MTLGVLRRLFLTKPGAYEDLPFGPETLVFKVMGKMFGLVGVDEEPLQVNLKCDPDWAIDLRHRYDSIRGAYHMNKKHWNTVTLDGSVPEPEMQRLIDHSYELVVAGLPQKHRKELGLGLPGTRRSK